MSASKDEEGSVSHENGHRQRKAIHPMVLSTLSTHEVGGQDGTSVHSHLDGATEKEAAGRIHGAADEDHGSGAGDIKSNDNKFS